MSNIANAFDLVVVVLLLGSAIIGFARGAVREVLSITAFVVAVIATAWGAPMIWDQASSLLGSEWMGRAAAVFGVFVVVFLAISFLTNAIRRIVHDRADIGLIDRILGFGFGVGRGIVIAALGLLIVESALPQTEWPTEGRAYRVIKPVADWFGTVSDPDSLLGRTARQGAQALPPVAGDSAS